MQRTIQWAIALLALGLAACPGEPKSQDPLPPEVMLYPMPKELVGTELTFTVETKGCEKIASVAVRDGDDILAQVDNPEPIQTLTASPGAVDYRKRGVAASLALFADATCGDGRTGTSREFGLSYLPAAEVLPGSWPFAINFWIEGDAETFLACNDSPAEDRKALVRYDREKNRLKRLALPWNCSASTEVVFGGNGNIYAFDPGYGIVGFQADGSPLFEMVPLENVMQVLVANTSSGWRLFAVVSTQIGWGLMSFNATFGWDATHQPIWAITLTEAPAGRLTLSANGELVYPCYWTTTGTEFVNAGISRYKSDDLSQGAHLGKYPLVPPFSVSDFTRLAMEARVPQITFDEGATTAYFAESDTAYACKVAIGNCNRYQQNGIQPGLVFSAPLSGGIKHVARTKDAVAVFGDHVLYFLDPRSGVQLGTPTTSTGAIAISWVQPLSDASGNSAIALAVTPGRSGIKELLFFDQPGELAARWTTGIDGYMVDFSRAANTASVWLYKQDLARLLTAQQYRQGTDTGSMPHPN